MSLAFVLPAPVASSVSRPSCLSAGDGCWDRHQASSADAHIGTPSQAACAGVDDLQELEHAFLVSQVHGTGAHERCVQLLAAASILDGYKTA
jgi:hypothetical protein